MKITHTKTPEAAILQMILIYERIWEHHCEAGNQVRALELKITEMQKVSFAFVDSFRDLSAFVDLVRPVREKENLTVMQLEVKTYYQKKWYRL